MKIIETDVLIILILNSKKKTINVDRLKTTVDALLKLALYFDKQDALSSNIKSEVQIDLRLGAKEIEKVIEYFSYQE